MSFEANIYRSKKELNLLVSGCFLLFSFETSAVAADVEPDLALYDRGLELYQKQCAECHGETGEGDGQLASKQVTAPRNFTIGNFKFRTTGLAGYPARQDIVQTLDRGIIGSAGASMPSFIELPLEDKYALAEVVRVFAEIPEFDEPIAIPAFPGRSDPNEGARLFNEAGCVDCHGIDGDGNGILAADLKDADGYPIQPANFTIGAFKGGDLPNELWMRIFSGLDGTPMPSFQSSLEDNEIWALVEYVQAFKK